MEDLPIREASALKPGDRYIRTAYNTETGDDEDVIVTVLGEQQPCSDIFGRDMIRYWATRADTGAEGWVIFGPHALVKALKCDWQTAYGLPWTETCDEPAAPGQPWCVEHCQDWQANYGLPLPGSARTC
ncbi:hypothetical protein [Micromonospora sp. WMMD736]|uniref:hypothetical protein n=1 Tax=Micromonospora sp. WMMD736 TaxID=3404112 RepID=UPI003B950A1C